jgi:hypothetical protein
MTVDFREGKQEVGWLGQPVEKDRLARPQAAFQTKHQILDCFAGPCEIIAIEGQDRNLNFNRHFYSRDWSAKIGRTACLKLAGNLS